MHMNFRFGGGMLAAVSLGMMTVGSALAADPATIRWGNTGAASVPQGLSKVVSLDEALQKKHGVKLEMTDFRGNSANCMAALIADAVDVCQTGITTGLSAIAEGGEFKSFATMGGQIQQLVVGKAAAEKAGIDLKAPVAERIAKLKGLQIVGSGPGTPNYLILDVILKKGGLGIADVNFRTLVDIVAMNVGVKNGQIDGTWWSAGGLGPSLAEGAAVVIVSMGRGDIPDLKNIPLTAVFAKTAWLEKNKAAAKGAKEAMKEAIAKMKADPEKYPATYKQAVMPDLDQAIWKDIVDQNLNAYFPDLNATEEAWNFWIEPMKAENKPFLDRATYANAFVNLD